MDLSLLGRGIVIGFSIAAPVGPIGILCIRRTLSEGRVIGLLSGLGAASADAVYGCIAGFGLTLISSFLVNQQIWLRLLGGLFLCYLGYTTFVAKPAQQAATVQGNGLLGAYTSTFLLTLTNPMTILAFTGIFAGLGIVTTSDHDLSAGILVLGVFLGSALWWCLLSTGTSVLQTRLNGISDGKGMQWVNRVSGVIIMAFGIMALFSVQE
ncbi:MAG: LysE family transporter [Leptolyngbyaceae bacterium]|nr:LysE family transporter [Leptolyngbyaceae bacterium]